MMLGVGLNEQHSRPSVDRPRQIQVHAGDLAQAALRGHGVIDDQDVNGAEPTQGILDHPRGLARIGEVGLDGRQARSDPTELLDDARQLRGVRRR